MSALSGLLTPPGSPNTGWITLPAISAMNSRAILRACDHLAADLEAHLPDDAHDVPGARGRRRPDDEIRPAEEVEVQRVILEHEEVVEEFADLVAGRRRVDVVEVVEGAGRGHVVRRGTDAADALRDLRHFLGGAPDAEPLEAAQFGDLQVRVGHLARVVEEDLDLAVAFESRDGVDGDALAHTVAPVCRRRSRDVGSENR